MVDLAIAYRIYPGVSRTPATLSNDKFKMSELCLQSFKRALGPMRVKIWAILDGCPPAYDDLFRSQFTEDELEIVHLNCVGNLPTFVTQIDLLTRQTDSDLVYFAEDDYFYLSGALVKVVAFARSNPGVEFVTPYDHPDYYDLLGGERHRILPSVGHHWRTASATCLTFLATRRALLRMQRHLRTYSRGSSDGSMWLALTRKLGLFNFQAHRFGQFDLPAHLLGLSTFKLWINTWLWGYRHILFDRTHQLWCPIPSLSTHMEVTRLAPLVDWFAEFDDASSKNREIMYSSGRPAVTS